MKKVFVAGASGLVGSALVRRFQNRPGVTLATSSRSEADLRDPAAVEKLLAKLRPDTVILAAGTVGGISANSKRPADFLYDNLMIEANLIQASWKSGVGRLLNFGSGCMYPRECPQPMRPDQLMTGQMEPTSEPYAIAKLAGMALCQAIHRQHGARFITAIPCTVYGPGDNFDLEQGHVLSALLRRMHEAKLRGNGELELWGTGSPKREFLYCDDLAEACELLIEKYDGEGPINIGSGESISIRELAALCAETVGFTGPVKWDSKRPDGAPEKRLEVSEIFKLGWKPRTDLREGLRRTYEWYRFRECQVQEPDPPGNGTGFDLLKRLA